MTRSESMKFRLPNGWTLRKVATALAREWLPPFLADAGPKAPRWVLQPVVEQPDGEALPLWEAGITTEEYEQRLERPDLSWVIRANVARGRGKGTVLARLSVNEDQPETIHMSVMQSPIPESVFDSGKVDEFLQARGAQGMEGLMAGLLSGEGFQHIVH